MREGCGKPGDPSGCYFPAEWRRQVRASAARCVNHPDLPSRVNLDGDNLCQECADAWVRAEGQWQAVQDRKAP